MRWKKKTFSTRNGELVSQIISYLQHAYRSILIDKKIECYRCRSFHLEIGSQGELSSVTPLFRRVIMYMHAKGIRVRSQVVLVNFQILFSILFEKIERTSWKWDRRLRWEKNLCRCCHRERIVFLTCYSMSTYRYNDFTSTILFYRVGKI